VLVLSKRGERQLAIKSVGKMVGVDVDRKAALGLPDLGSSAPRPTTCAYTIQTSRGRHDAVLRLDLMPRAYTVEAGLRSALAMQPT
jgi:hypothetical protein